MKININKKEIEATGVSNLLELLEREHLAAPGRAVAVGSRVVPRSLWNTVLLSDGMEITVISAVCGG